MNELIDPLYALQRYQRHASAQDVPTAQFLEKGAQEEAAVS